MTLQEKHLQRMNKLSLFINVITTSLILLFALLCLTQFFRIGQVVQAIVAIIDLIVNFIFYKKYKHSINYKYIVIISLGLVCLSILCTARFGYMAIYIFPVTILVMIFQDKKLGVIGAVLGCISITIFETSCMIKGGTPNDECIMYIFVVFIVCIMASKIAKTQNLNSLEDLEAITQAAEAQTNISNQIVTLAEELSEKFKIANEVSETLNNSMGESHDAITIIAERTHANADLLCEQTNQTSDIHTSIQQVGEQTQKMGEISSNTNGTVEEGVKLINKLGSQAKEVERINTETQFTTNKLNERIQDVENITGTILSISTQTNLLALNASIEAARAGEAGKGFAVVADEIRKLSEDTRKATEQISQIISNLTNDARTATESMAESAKYAKLQNDLINNTGSKLNDIKNNTDLLYEYVTKISTAVENVILANSEIMNSVSDLSASGQEVAASTDVAFSLSDNVIENLNEMNRLLHEISSIAIHMQEIAS